MRMELFYRGAEELEVTQKALMKTLKALMRPHEEAQLLHPVWTTCDLQAGKHNTELRRLHTLPASWLG